MSVFQAKICIQKDCDILYVVRLGKLLRKHIRDDFFQRFFAHGFVMTVRVFL